jgi:ubiquinone/menaquinone biosynthesis C-methylase UbiE
MKEFWNERYRAEEYAYGEEPNAYFKTQLMKLKPGKILLPAEGEGRNACFAAKQGWDVYAFDLSEQGKNKALKLAQKNNVSINYEVCTLEEISFGKNSFDAIALIYAHFPAADRFAYHRKLTEYLKKDGTIIVEAFNKKHGAFQMINPTAGGPRNAEMLYSDEELESDFAEFNIIELIEQETELSEGIGHLGKAAIIRFIGRKIA